MHLSNRISARGLREGHIQIGFPASDDERPCRVLRIRRKTLYSRGKARKDFQQSMFPLDPGLLMLLKFFVVLTCVCFWIELAWGIFTRALRRSDSGRHRQRHDSHEDR
jgi:hypothetical protein